MRRWHGGVLLPLVAVLGGCSDQLPPTAKPVPPISSAQAEIERADYASVMGVWSTPLQNDLETAGSACATTASAPCAQAMTAVAGDARAFLAALNGKTLPPAYAAGDHDLREGLMEMQAACTAAAAAVTAQNTQQLENAVVQLNTGKSLLGTAEQLLSAEGGV